MRIEPHENLTVLSIRHDRFGPGRFHALKAGLGHKAHAHRHEHSAAAHAHQLHTRPQTRPRVEVRVVEHTRQPQPADCRPCHHGEPARPSMNPVFLLYAPTISVAWPYNALHADPATLLPPVAVQRFAHGQPVPTLGGLLDVLA